MIPVNQTIVDFETGDCFRACVASIFDLSLDYVPNFMQDGVNGFNEYVTEWCDQFGIVFLDILLNDYTQMLLKDTYMIAAGPSPRRPEGGDQLHSVVWYNGKMVHDPIPPLSPAHRRWKTIGLDGDPELYTVFVIKDPAKYLKMHDSCPDAQKEIPWADNLRAAYSIPIEDQIIAANNRTQCDCKSGPLNRLGHEDADTIPKGYARCITCHILTKLTSKRSRTP